MTHFEKAVRASKLDVSNYSREDFITLAKKIPKIIWDLGKEQDSVAKQFNPHIVWINSNLKSL